MFTGIIQSVAEIVDIRDHNGMRTFVVEFKLGFCNDLEIGASIAIDGVCLTVTEILSRSLVKFDVMLQSLATTTLSEYTLGTEINVERAAKYGAEIGGHPLSGHVDFKSAITLVKKVDENYCVRFKIDDQWKRYIFPKGYIALNGASLTIAEVNKDDGWFEVWLIPETRRMTVFEQKTIGDNINVEIERTTQVIVDTVRETIREDLGELYPLFVEMLKQEGVDVESIGQRAGVKNTT